VATSPVPLWAQEMSPHHRGPTGAGVLALAVIVVLVVLMFSAIPTAQGGDVVDHDQGSLCDQHRGQPSWAGICKEQRRGR
jgi:hypothetical protein